MGISTREVLVRIILRKNDLALVQWYVGNTPSRAWITPDMIVSENGDEAIVDSPEAGIPYGMEWSKMIELNATSKDLEANLRKQGIWTVADLREHPEGVRSALQATYGIDAATLHRVVRDL